MKRCALHGFVCRSRSCSAVSCQVLVSTSETQIFCIQVFRLNNRLRNLKKGRLRQLVTGCGSMGIFVVLVVCPSIAEPCFLDRRLQSVQGLINEASVSRFPKVVIVPFRLFFPTAYGNTTFTDHGSTEYPWFCQFPERNKLRWSYCLQLITGGRIRLQRISIIHRRSTSLFHFKSISATREFYTGIIGNRENFLLQKNGAPHAKTAHY